MLWAILPVQTADAHLCYNASVRARRSRISVDSPTLKKLKALAMRRHQGDVSALLTEVADREVKFAAAEAYFEKYGVPPLTNAKIERIEAEWRVDMPCAKRRRGHAGRRLRPTTAR